MKNYFTLFLLAFVLLAGCVRDKETEKSQEELAFDKAKSLITQMGYDTSDMYEGSYGYVVEGDILITQEYLDDYVSKPQTRHTFNSNGLMVAPNYQKIGIYGYGTTDLINDVQYAAQYWNEKTDCAIIFDQSASMSIEVSFKEFPNNNSATLMQVEPPTSLGLPGKITINTLCSYLPAPGEQAQYMILHAIGHAIGFGHTPKDYFDNTVTDPFIEDTVPDDSGSIMVKESVPLKWTGISKYDIEAFKIKYPKTEPEPTPEIDPSVVFWSYNENFKISLKSNLVQENTNFQFDSYISYVGNSWASYKSHIKYILVVDNKTGERQYGKITDTFNLPYGSYNIYCGVAEKQSDGDYEIQYGNATLNISQTSPRITSNIDFANVEFVTKTYRIKSEFDTKDPAWQSYTSTAKLTNVETGKEIILRPAAGATHEFLVTIPERACYIATVTINNGSETKTGTLSIDLTGKRPTTPVFYKMQSRYESPTVIPNEVYIRYYLEFYSDAACTQRIQSTPYCIVFDYKLWEHYYNIHNVLENSRIWSEDRCIVPPRVSTFDLPILIPNYKPFTLDKYVYKYELSNFGYM